jgi:hypothetical protein
MNTPGKRRGRPRTQADEIKQSVISMRTNSALKVALEKVSKASGRSLAAEIEYRLATSLEADTVFDIPNADDLEKVIGIIGALLGELTLQFDRLAALYHLDQALKHNTEAKKLLEPFVVAEGTAPKPTMDAIEQSVDQAERQAKRHRAEFKEVVERIRRRRVADAAPAEESAGPAAIAAKLTPKSKSRRR